MGLLYRVSKHRATAAGLIWLLLLWGLLASPAAAAVAVAPDAGGQWRAAGTLNGHALVWQLRPDSEHVLLSPARAAAAGLEFRHGLRRQWAGPEGGVGYQVMVGEVGVGGIVLRDVPVLVVERLPVDTAVLGRPFLGRIATHHQGGRLLLRP